MSDENVGGLVELPPLPDIGPEGWYTRADMIAYARAALSAHGQPVVDDSQRKWAQGLIEQLPREHDGRNSWLLNYGVGHESDWLRAEHKRYRQAWQDWRDGYPQPTMRRYQDATAALTGATP